MAMWKQVKIGDVCVVERGGSPRPIDKFITDKDNGINWIKIGDTTDSMYITRTAQKIIPEGVKKSRYVQPGDFLLSNSMSFGRPYILAIDGCIHDGWLVLRDKNNSFDKHFLYYCLSAPITYRKFKSMAVGGVVNNLNSEMVRGVSIPLPPLDEQRRIAATLDKVTDLISKRRQQLDKLDELVKARFGERFIHYTQFRKLEELTTLITKGSSPKWQGIDYTDSGTLFVTSENVQTGFLDLKKRKYLDNRINEIQPRSILHRNDVLINIVGASIGRAAIFDCDELANINQAVALVRIDVKRTNLKFLITYLNSLAAMDIYTKMKKGGARDNLSLRNIADLPIPVVPLEAQDQFASFVDQTENVKVTIKRSLEKLETLKKALMQEYFG